MMFLDQENKLVRTQADDFLKANANRFVVSSDYNNVIFKLERKEGTNRIYLSFTCPNFKQIFAIAGQHFLTKYYKDYNVEANESGFDITVSADCSVMLDVQKPKKDSSPEEVKQIKETNAQNRKLNEVIRAKMSSQLANFKRNFYAACFESAFEGIVQGAVPKPFSFQSRPNETVWVIPDGSSFKIYKVDQLNVFYGVSFDDEVDKILAKLILDEMVEAKRHVKNAPQVGRTLEQEQIPKILLDNFPDLVKNKPDMKNGILSITLFKQQHFATTYENQATMLQGFRQYIHYHIHASKTYLHTRVVRRINQFYRQLSLSQFEKDEVQTRPQDEEKKSSSVIKAR